MAGPWEKYQQAPAAAGPWQKYQSAPAPQAAAPQPEDVRGATGVPGGVAETPAPAPPAAPVNQGNDAPVYAAQQTSRGVADVLGAPVDLMSMAVNMGLVGADKMAELFGGNLDARVQNPIGGSDWIADKASSAYEGIGGRVVPPEAVSPGVRLAGAGARGLSSAVIPGMALASKPAQVAAQAGKMGSVGRVMAQPYASRPGSTLVHDAAAGVGAGMGAQSVDEYAPESVQDSFAGPLLKAGAALAGGVGGSGLASVAEGSARGVGNMARNMVKGKGDPNAPVNPATGQPFTRTEMDRAAYVAQQMPTDKAQALDNIDTGAKEFRQFAGDNEMPTVGMLADDIGMASQENVLRARDPQRFAERDAARRSLASQRVDASAPRGADGRNFTNEAARQHDDALRAASAQVDDVAARQAAAQADVRRQNTDLEAYRAQQPEASSAMASDYEAARKAARSQKNALYDAADPKTPVDGRFLDEAVKRIDDEMPAMEKAAGGPYSVIANRVRNRLASEDPVTYGDLKALRAQISEARKAAVWASGQSVAGSGADVQRLDQLGKVVDHLTDKVNPEAARFYSEEYAPRFKEGKSGEYGAALDRAARTGGDSSATRPSEFGDKFLRKPEDAASLKKAATPIRGPNDKTALPGPEASGPPTASRPDQATVANAKNWMLGDLAKSGVLTDDAGIRFDKFKQWADKNRKTIDQFPEIAETVDTELAKAQRGGALSRQLGKEIAEAKAAMKSTEAEMRSSALRNAIGRNPANAVDGIMSSGDPEKQMVEMVTRLSGNKDATDGLKAGVRDWIKTKAGLTSKIVGDPDAVRLSRAKVENLFQKHEKTLASVYSPDEMNALRQAHKLLDAEAKLDVRATSGSNTFDKIKAGQKASATQNKRLMEAALKAKFGVLKGGGIFRTMNLFLESLPDGSRGLDDILFDMQFNPDLAKHLLTRPVKDVGSPDWNSKLNSLLAVATGARESVGAD